MAVSDLRVKWNDLSPSCRGAFSWAAAAAEPDQPVGSTAILAGMVRAHEGTSLPEQLLSAAGSRKRGELFRALEKTEEGIVRATVKGPRSLRAFPELTAPAERLLDEAADLSADHPARDGKLHMQHLFGGVLSVAETPAYRALASLVTRDLGRVREEYVGYLAAVQTNPSLQYSTYLDSLAGPPLVSDTPIPVPDLFVGREAEREGAEKALRTGRCVLFVGPAGVGKSSLANVVANDVRDAFPDGIQTAAMLGRDPAAVAAELLAAAGQAPGRDPVAAYRSYLAGRKALLVLHDAGPGAEQLIPEPPSAAIVTSRTHLSLPVETTELTLSPFDEGEARAVLDQLGVSASPELVHDVLDVALRSPQNVRLAGDLIALGVPSEELLRIPDELAAGGAPDAEDVEAAGWFEAVAIYEKLGSGERAFFRRIGLLDDSFGAGEAGGVADTTLEHAEATLEQLAELGIVQRQDEGRYWIDPITQAYARERLAEEESPVAQREAAIRALGVRHGIGLATRFTPVLAGHIADTPSKTDHLDFDPDVEALCSVLITKDVNPPISVGLFGDWGTGKSTFMALMRKRVRELSDEWRDRDDPPFCLNVKQITFNAWHYSDANLWASIATRIFEGLAKSDPDIDGDEALSEAELAAVADKLETAQLQITEKEVELADARAHRRVLEQRRDQLRREEASAIARLGSIRPDDILREARADPYARALAAKLDTELQGAGGDAIATARDLTALGGRLRALWREVPGRRRLLLLAACVVALMLLGVGIWLTAVNGWFAAAPLGVAAAWITAAAAIAGPALKRVRAAAATARAYLERIDERQAARQRLMEVAIQEQLAQLAARRTQIEHDLDAARVEAARAQREIDDIRTGRRLARFVEERAGSVDYAAYLGLIALIRRDFDRLRVLLREGSESPGPRIDRIILYIDDLDRCPAARVVEVLEAVHLLLALDLFVVVVGVDPRWLLRSLERHYSAQLGQDDGDRQRLPHDLPDDWTTTPQNYLEKIFQIPLAIRPMGKQGYERLVGSLFDVRTSERRREDSGSEPDLEEQEQQPAEETAADEEERDEPIQRTPPAPELQLERLTVWDAELEFLKTLAPLVPTPRAAKRLANTYRLIRASLDARSLRDFVRDEGKSGAYQAALILLGILIGAPTDASTVLRALREASDDDLQSFVERIGELSSGDADATRRLNELRERLERVIATASPVEELDPYREWVPRIGRYSFDTGRAFVDEGTEQAPELSAV